MTRPRSRRHVEEVLSATNAIASERMGAAHLRRRVRASRRRRSRAGVLFAAQTDLNDKLMLGDLESRVSSGLAYLQTAKVDEALVLIEDAAALSPTSPYALSAFALVDRSHRQARRGDRRGRLGRPLRPVRATSTASPRVRRGCSPSRRRATRRRRSTLRPRPRPSSTRPTTCSLGASPAWPAPRRWRALGADGADELRSATQAELVALGAPAEGWATAFRLAGARARRGRRRRLLTTGLIVGRFCPPHLGHSHLIESAAAQVDQLVVFVNTRDGEVVPGELRAEWLARAASRRRPSSRCATTSTPTSTTRTSGSGGSPSSEHAGRSTRGPDVDFSSEAYGTEIARRLGRRGGRRRPRPGGRADLGHDDPRADPRAHLDPLAPPVRARGSRRDSLVGLGRQAQVGLERLPALRELAPWRPRRTRPAR